MLCAMSLTQLSSLRSVAAQRAEQEQALATARDAYDLAVLRYREGVGNYLQVLSTEDQLLTQQRLARGSARTQPRSVGRSDRALGGGFEAAAGTLASFTLTGNFGASSMNTSPTSDTTAAGRRAAAGWASDSAALRFSLSPSASTGLTRCATASRPTMPT